MKKFGLVLLVLVIALGALGVAYSDWTDQVNISGPVSTGKVIWQFVQPIGSLDPCPHGPPWYVGAGKGDWTSVPDLNGDVYQMDKNVGCTDVNVIDPHNLQVDLWNVYPCYYTDVTVHMKNLGSIPVRILGPVLTYPDPNNPGEDITVVLPNYTIVHIIGFDQYGGISDVIELRWVDNTGEQVEPGQKVEDSMEIHVMQAAQQSFQYTFHISLQVVQWNEYD